MALVAVRRGKCPVVWKGIASTGFLLTAFGGGAFGTPYGIGVFIALVFCWLGDIALSYTSKPAFLCGLIVFLLGHIALIVVFVRAGIAPAWNLAAGVATVLAAIPILRWLYPKVPPDMKLPVLAYMLVITLMVITAAGAVGSGETALLLLGAVLFYVSDIFVARETFVSPGYVNYVLGLPQYYAAVSLLALSVAYQ